MFDHSETCDRLSLDIAVDLHMALKRLRQSGRKVVWADAICIQQTDLEVRIRQLLSIQLLIVGSNPTEAHIVGALL